jgi:hypothetical protein
MKKTGFLSAMLFFVTSLFSQPVLNSSLNFTIGDTYRIDGYFDVPVIDPGEPGANKVWDFEVIEGEMFIEGEPAICVDPSTTPFADSAAVIFSQICTKSQFTGDFGPYGYYHTTASSSEMVAIGWHEPGNTSFGNYDPPLSYLKYPLSYGDGYDFNYDYTSYHLDFGYHYYRDSGYVQVVADAWGSITTPIGTFPNVLRLKVITLAHTWYRFEAGEPWTYTGEFETTSYQWFAPDIKVPLMNIQQQEFDKLDFFTTHPAYSSIPCKKICAGYPENKFRGQKESFNVVQYVAAYDFMTGMDEQKETGFVVYPNPATTFFRFQTPDGQTTEEVLIYDSHGKVVFRDRMNGETVDGLSLSPGLYIVEILSGTGTRRTKLVIEY